MTGPKLIGSSTTRVLTHENSTSPKQGMGYVFYNNNSIWQLFIIGEN